MTSITRPRRTFSKRHRVYVALFLGAAIVATIALRNRSQPAYTHVPIDTTNPFIVKLQNGEANVQMLVNALGSSDKTTRRQAARAIVALRQHYIDEVAQVVQEGYDRGLNGHSFLNSRRIWWKPWATPVNTVFGGPAPPEVTVQIRAMYLLAKLRPTDSMILNSAAQHTTFYYDSGFNNALTLISPPATEILVGSSLAALPTLVEYSMDEPAAPKTWLDAPSSTCLTTILGAMSSSWIQQQSRKHAQLKPLSQKLATTSSFSWKSEMGNASIAPAIDALGAEFPDVKTFDLEIAQEKYIEWNIRTKLLDDHDLGGSSTSYPQSSPQSSRTVADVNRPLRLLQYAISHRLYSLKYDGRSHCAWAKNTFPEAAKLDSILVLGALRSREDNVFVWMRQRLRKLDRIKPLDRNFSPEVQAILRTAGQIDVPFSRHAMQNFDQDDDTGRGAVVATFVLSKIYGPFAQDLVKNEILQQNSQSWKDALQIARRKGWFKGELFDAQQSRAYDLVFPDEPEK